MKTRYPFAATARLQPAAAAPGPEPSWAARSVHLLAANSKDDKECGPPGAGNDV